MSGRADRDATARWQEQKRFVAAGTAGVRKAESAGEKAARVEKAREDFRFFVTHYFPHYAKSETPDFHVEAALKVKGDPQIKGIVEWFRGAAKSVLFDTMIPLWLMLQKENQCRCAVVIGLNETAAIRLLSDVQAELEANELLIHDFGPQVVAGSWEDKEFSTAAGSSFVALGMGQSVRGLRNRDSRPDYIVIDDIDTEAMSRNPRRIDETVRWIERSVLGTFDSGRARLFVVNNRIAKDQVMSRMVATKPHWWHHFVPAHDGVRSAWPAKYSMEFWAQREKDAGAAAFSTEYLLVPVVEGRQFKDVWIIWAQTPPLLRVVAYIDPSWRDGAKSDHKAAKVWASTGPLERHLLRAFVRQCSIDELAQWCYDTHERLQHLPVPVIAEWYLEGIFMQDNHLDEFQRVGRDRGWFLPILPDMRKKPDKTSRIASMIPIYKRGLLTYDESQRHDPDMMRAVDHLLGWDLEGGGLPDDSPDADESALHILDNRRSFDAGSIGMDAGPGPSSSRYKF
jgi:hypothetical protein